MHFVDCHMNITMCWLFQELSVAASQSYSSLLLESSVQCHSAVSMPVDHSRFKRRIIIEFLLSSSSIRETGLCFQHGAMVLCPDVEWKRDRYWKITAGCMISFCFMTTRFVIVIVHKSTTWGQHYYCDVFYLIILFYVVLSWFEAFLFCVLDICCDFISCGWCVTDIKLITVCRLLWKLYYACLVFDFELL